VTNKPESDNLKPTDAHGYRPDLAEALNKPKPCLPSVAGSFVALAKKDSEGGSAAEGKAEGYLR